jgi:hypothetical protein
MPRSSTHASAQRTRLPQTTRISRAVRGALAATTALLALAGAEATFAAPAVQDLTQVTQAQAGADTPALQVGPVEILQAGDIAFDNVDDVYGSDDAAPWDVTAVLLHSYAGDVLAYNEAGASIVASIEADTGYVLARGIASYGVDSFVSNSGDIEAVASVELGNSVAIAAISIGAYFSTLYNQADASIVASAFSGQGVDYGPDANAFAVFVSGTSAYTVNDGAIVAQAQADGNWSLAAATGVRSEAFYGFATLVNYGDIAAYATTTSNADTKTYAFAYAIDTQAHYGRYTASTVNAGDVLAVASAYRGGAISIGSRTYADYSLTENDAGGTIAAYSFVEYSGLANATGVETSAKYYAHDVNAGSISAYASSHDLAHYGYFSYGGASATGVRETASYFGGVVMENSGTISATASTRDVAGFFFGGAAATGVYQDGKYYAGLDNSGDIHAQAYSELGVTTAYGVVSRSKYGSYTVVENHEGASIVAVAETGSAAGDTYAGRAIAHGINMFGGSFALVYNDGLISASALVDPRDRDYFDNPAIAYAYGVAQRGSYGATLENTGTIEAYAGADFGQALAYGAKVTGQYYAVAYNHGDLVAVADADDGTAFATGLLLSGTGRAVYQGCDPYGCHYAYYGGLAAAVNDGSVYARADAQDGLAGAYGIVEISRYDGQFDNSGDVVAIADAGSGYAQAYGALVRSDYQGVSVHNDAGGLIFAGAYGDHASATALWLGAAYDAYLRNDGSIIAAGDGARVAIDASNVVGNTSIFNSGLIAGSILLGDGDDSLYNEAGGVLRLDDSLVDFGGDAGGGNRFYNDGRIRVSGSNAIDMGGTQTLVPSLNSNAFYNDGVLDFQDGAPDDYLLVTGDFAGHGDIDVDVSGLDAASDVLAIDGSVVAGTVQTINVDLSDLSHSIEALIPVVTVSGNSVAGNFVIGDVQYDDVNTFVTLDFAIVADIHPTNTAPDVFNLGIEVTGLSDPGALAASIPGQRMGVIDASNKGAVSLWARVFTDKGSFTPDHVAANFGNAGNFDWDQKNSGAEAGVDFTVTDELSLGLLMSKSHADTHLEHPGAGSARLDADTWGVYGTWISPNGFYLDASYRRMDFDVDLSSVAGSMQASGDAEAFNAEAGYAWTLSGGLKVEPQLQYTRTSVDHIDVLATTTGMDFRNDGGDSSRGRLGVAFRKGFGDADAGWLWTPQLTLSAVREFDGRSVYAINDAFLGTTSIEGTSALLELGVTARHGNWSLQGGVNRQDGGAIGNALGGQLQISYTFGAIR